MTGFHEAMWSDASRDTSAEHSERVFALAKVATASVWPFLAAAGSAGEYAQRKALVADRLDAAVHTVVGSLDPTLRAKVEASLDEDFTLLHTQRTAEALTAALQAQAAYDPSTGVTHRDYCTKCGEDIEKSGDSYKHKDSRWEKGTRLDADHEIVNGGATTAAKTASTYCPAHGVYVGEGNQEQHDHCKTEQRKSKDSAKTAGKHLNHIGKTSDPNIFAGTDNQGQRVYFYVSDEEAAQLLGILYSDLAANFSGVEVNPQDVAMNPDLMKGSSKTAVVAEAGLATAATASTTTITWDSLRSRLPFGGRTAAGRENLFAGTFSRACLPHGDGICDGYVPEDEKNGGEQCDCPCHESLTLPDTIEGVKAWHDKMWSGTLDVEGSRKTAAGCVCVTHSDGSVTTMLCPQHATEDPCATMAAVTGQRRRGTIRNGTCTACGWSAKKTAAFGDDAWGHGLGQGEGLVYVCPYCEFVGTAEEQEQHIKDAGPGHRDHGTVTDQMNERLNSEGAKTKTAGYGDDPDGTPYGAWGDHCPFCGNDWKQEHDPSCLRVTDPAMAEAAEQRAEEYHRSQRTSMRKGAPFAGYEDFAACVAANQDKDDPEAYCGAIKHRTEDKKTAASTRYETAKKVLEGGIFTGPGNNEATIDGAILDASTANLIVQAYEALSPENQAKFDSIPLDRLTEFLWQRASFPSYAAKAAAVVACRKCVAGRDPSGGACDYCDGQGHLDQTLAMVKAADGWEQGLTAEAFVRTAAHDMVECWSCAGTGKVPAGGWEKPEDVTDGYVDCPECDGTGEIFSTEAPDTKEGARTALIDVAPYNGHQATVVYTTDFGVKTEAGRVEVSGGTLVLHKSGGVATTIPSYNVMAINVLGHGDERDWHEGPGREPTVVDYAFSGLAPSTVASSGNYGGGAVHLRMTANPYVPENNPYTTKGPGDPGSEFRDQQARDDKPQMDMQPSEPVTTRPRQMPSGSETPGPMEETTQDVGDDTFAKHPESTPGGPSTPAAVARLREAERSFMAPPPDRYGHPRVAAKIAEITEGLLATNPGMNREAARSLAEQTVQQYPAMVGG